jgi:hypothetical protein
MTETLVDVAGRRRSPATLPGFGAGRPPRNKGMRYRPIRRPLRRSPSYRARRLGALPRVVENAVVGACAIGRFG